jgi:ABC-type sulfate/molybdate transport systems ATPase subunit
MTTVSGCDRIYRLEQGIIVQEGPAKEVLASPEIHLVNDRDIQQKRS